MQFLYGITMAGLGSALAFAAGVALWFILRRKLQRLWLPILRVVKRPPKRMPRLRLVTPPWVPFACFVLAAAMLLAFAWAPAREVVKPLSREENRLHIFVDLSPSVSGRVSIDQLRSVVRELWSQLSGSGQVTASTSDVDQVVSLANEEQLGDWLAGLGFQRGGARLGAIFKHQISRIGKISGLYIVSDADFYSWGDFNWQFLAADNDVIFVPVSMPADQSALTNFYFNQIKFVEDPLSTRVTWEVEIAAAGAHSDVSGSLRAVFNQQTLAQVEWRIPAGSKTTRVVIDWSEADAARTIGVADAGVPIRFVLATAAADAIGIDNELRVAVRGVRRAAMIVAEPSGEMNLEDPAFHLRNALQVLGYQTNRLDYVQQPGPDPGQFSLLVVAGGSGKGVDFFCPDSIMTARQRGRSSATALPMVWLAPRSLNADYRELCYCFDRLTSANPEQPSRSLPYCDATENRDGWISVLRSLGAKQVGGALGEDAAAIAWQKVDPQSGLQVLAFSLPLVPSRFTGLSYAGMPLILRELLTWKGQLTNAEDDGKSWPRVADLLTARLEASSVGADAVVSEQLLESNVPTGESMLVQVDAANLPPTKLGSSVVGQQALAAARVHLDPMPLLRMMLLAVLAAMLLEIFWYLLVTVRARRAAAAAVSVLFAALLVAPAATAGVRLVTLGYPAITQNSASDIAREVAQRTSIDLDTKLIAVEQAKTGQLLEPWLWIRGVSALTSQSVKFRNDFLLWLKTGGFAVFEDVGDMAALEKYTAQAFAHEPFAAQWQPLPPDHELMRSFHLLDTLPTCAGKLWRGLHFDGRLVAVAIPHRFLEQLLDKPKSPGCDIGVDQERLVRVYVNLLMVVLATDYKKDQIHLPEILKRLR